jgi:CRP-like cAMP-binding protein
MSRPTKIVETLLARVDLFQGIGEAQRRMLADLCRFRHYPKGQVLFYEGDDGHELYLIRQGRVAISRQVRGGDSVLLAFRGAGDAIGEMSLFDGHPRSATATAVEDTDAAILRASDFSLCVRQSPSIALNALKHLSLRLREASDVTVDRQSRSSVERVAAELSKLCDEQGIDPAHKQCTLQLPYAQRTLADRVGVTRETVNRALKKLCEKGAISSVARNVYTLDRERLRRLGGASDPGPRATFPGA